MFSINIRTTLMVLLFIPLLAVSQKTPNKTDENGDKHGLWTEYTSISSETGKGTLKIKETGMYEHGERTGKWTGWYPNGKKYYEGTYQFDGSSSLMDGKWLLWKSDGSPKEEWYFTQGVRTSREYCETHKYSFLPSSPNATGSDGKKTGIWSFYTRYNGWLAGAHGEYSKGEQNGIWSYFYPDGSLLAIGTYDNGTLSGTWKEYHLNGTLSGECAYVRGLKDGPSFSWDDKGGKKETEYYYRGNPLVDNGYTLNYFSIDNKVTPAGVRNACESIYKIIMITNDDQNSIPSAEFDRVIIDRRQTMNATRDSIAGSVALCDYYLLLSAKTNNFSLCSHRSLGAGTAFLASSAYLEQLDTHWSERGLLWTNFHVIASYIDWYYKQRGIDTRPESLNKRLCTDQPLLQFLLVDNKGQVVFDTRVNGCTARLTTAFVASTGSYVDLVRIQISKSIGKPLPVIEKLQLNTYDSWKWDAFLPGYPVLTTTRRKYDAQDSDGIHMWISRGFVQPARNGLRFQTPTEIGQSGSPLLNTKGEVIGVLSQGNDVQSIVFPISEDILSNY